MQSPKSFLLQKNPIFSKFVVSRELFLAIFFFIPKGNWSMAGCSGYVQYKFLGVIFTIGFSNPSVGNNKVGVGISGKKVCRSL